MSESNNKDLRIDSIFEKVRVKGHSSFMAILIVSGLNKLEERDILAIEAYPDELKENYLKLFTSLKGRGLECPQKISTSNVLERLNKEFRRRSKTIGIN